MKYSIGAVSKYEDICLVWPKVIPFIEKALKKAQGEICESDLLHKIYTSKAQLWVVGVETEFAGVAITEIIEYPKKCNLRVIILGGERAEDWLEDLHQVLVRFAHSQQLQGIEACGRLGLVRRLKKLGFRPVYVVVLEDLGKPGPIRSALEEVLHV